MRLWTITCLFLMTATARLSAAAPAAEPPGATPLVHDEPASTAQPVIHVPEPAARQAFAGGDHFTTGTAPLQGAPASSEPPAMHTLETVRIRPQADALRLVFALDQPTPYALRLDPAGQRAWLDLINTRVVDLPPELARCTDPRLAGVWLTRADPGLVTLELRLRSDKTTIDHFALDDPAVIVLDLARSDLAYASFSPAPVIEPPPMPAVSAPAAAPALAAAPAPAEPLISDHGMALPAEHLEAAPDAPAAARDASTSASLPESPALPGAEATEPAPAPAPAPVATPAELPRQNVQMPLAPQAGAPAAPSRDSLAPASADFDAFPIGAVKLASVSGEELMRDFLYRRWASVYNKSLDYLKLNRINRETPYVLYLLAEAAWQLEAERHNRPLPDLANFYQQAVRAWDGGELGPFGHWRIATALQRMNDPQGRLAHLTLAAATQNPGLRLKVLTELARTLAELSRTDEALAQLAALEAYPGLTREQALELALLRGTILLDRGDANGAWAAYQQANVLDPKWTGMDLENCERMARAALGAGHPQEARFYVEFIINNFPYSREDQKVQLTFLYADVLAQLGDERTAEDTYAVLLNKLGNTAKGEQVRKMMMARHPGVMAEKAGRYCELLWRSGKIREAMAELVRAYDEGLRAGMDPAGLRPVMESVLPAFMEESAEARPYEVAQAWNRYNHLVKPIAARNRCRAALARAEEGLGLYREALELTNALLEEPSTPGVPAPQHLLLRQARLRMKLGEADQALGTLEALQREALEPELQAEVFEQLGGAYERAGRPLESAQAWQAMASLPGAEPATLAHGLLEAGRVFLGAGLPQPAIQVALKGLIIEDQLAKQGVGLGIPANQGNQLRLLMARAFMQQGDVARAGLTFEDYLTRSGIDAESRATARLLLADCLLKQGRTDLAVEAYKTLESDAQGPALPRESARQALAAMEWNKEHPEWTIRMER